MYKTNDIKRNTINNRIVSDDKYKFKSVDTILYEKRSRQTINTRQFKNK